MQLQLNTRDQTPLIILCKKSKNDDNHELIKMFIAQGADINHMDCKKNTPLMYLIPGNNPKSIELLLQTERKVKGNEKITEQTFCDKIESIEKEPMEKEKILIDDWFDNQQIWRDKYLSLFTEQKIKIPPIPLGKDLYDWRKEYERVSKFKYWDDIYMYVGQEESGKSYRCMAIKPRICELPKEVCYMEELEYLWISRCDLTGLPKEIGNLKNLIYLDISHNEIEVLPKEIHELSKLEKIKICKDTKLYGAYTFIFDVAY